MNKIALITGANSGIGLATAKNLAKQGLDLILIVRTEEKADNTRALIQKIKPNAKIDFYIADLSELDSVYNATIKIIERYKIIDIIINNAGYSPNVIEFTKEGYEKSFVANHLGHFLLTKRLINLIDAAKDGRVINVSSEAYKWGKFGALFIKNNPNQSLTEVYGNGKLANILFTKGLVKQLKVATAYSLHPGVVNTNFGSTYTGFFKIMLTLMRPFMISADKGAATSIYLATTPFSNLKGLSGQHFAKQKLKLLVNKELTESNIDSFWVKSEDAVSK